MKRYGNLFDAVFTEENLYQAYLDARQGKRGKRATFIFETRVGAMLAWLRKNIMDGTYKPQPYKQFTVYEPKARQISAPWFGDIVVQHAIYRVIRPIFDRTFIATSFACRQGLGTHKAADYAQEALRSSDPEQYTLKMDVRKFFYRIDRAILRWLIERKIKDKRLVDIMMLFAQGDGEVGIPIGNLLSQLYALLYLDRMDHFIKRTLKVKKYCRYVDDFILFGLSREECLAHKAAIERFLQEELHLELSKWSIQKVRRGVNFVGYRTWRSARFIRKFSLHKFRRRVQAGKLESIISLLGHAKRTCSLRYMMGVIDKETKAKLPRRPWLLRYSSA